METLTGGQVRDLLLLRPSGRRPHGADWTRCGQPREVIQRRLAQGLRLTCSRLCKYGGRFANSRLARACRSCTPRFMALPSSSCSLKERPPPSRFSKGNRPGTTSEYGLGEPAHSPAERHRSIGVFVPESLPQFFPDNDLLIPPSRKPPGAPLRPAKLLGSSMMGFFVCSFRQH